MQNQKDGKLTINNIIIGVNNKEILVEKLKRDILEQKNKYKISEYIIIEMEKDEETITYNTTEEFKDVYTEIVLPNTIISFLSFEIACSLKYSCIDFSLDILTLIVSKFSNILLL